MDRCENVINFEIVSRNAIKRDSSFNVYREWKICFEVRVVVEGSKTAAIIQHGGPRHPKTGHVDNLRNRRNQNLRLPFPYQRPQTQGPEEMRLSLEYQNPSKTSEKWVILIALQFRLCGCTFYIPQTKRLRARKIGLQYKIRKGRKQIWGRFSIPETQTELNKIA